MIKLKVKLEDKIITGQVKYDGKEGNLAYSPKLNSDISLLVGYINIGFDSMSMTANQVWGYTPRESWYEKKLALPMNICKGQIELDGEYEAGIWNLDKEKCGLLTMTQNRSGYVSGEFETKSSDTSIEFLTNVVAVLDNEQ